MGCGTSAFPKILHSEAREITESSLPSEEVKQIKRTTSEHDSSSASSEKNLVMKYEEPLLSRSSSLSSSTHYNRHNHHHYNEEENEMKINDNPDYSFLFLDPSNVPEGKHDSVSDAESGIELTDQKTSDHVLQGPDAFEVKEIGSHLAEEDAQSPLEAKEEEASIEHLDENTIADEIISNVQVKEEKEEAISDKVFINSFNEKEVPNRSHHSNEAEEVLSIESSKIVEVDENEVMPPILIHNEVGEVEKEENVLATEISSNPWDDFEEQVVMKLEKYDPDPPRDLYRHGDAGSLILDMEPKSDSPEVNKKSMSHEEITKTENIESEVKK